MNKPGDEVVIYSHALQKVEELGEARLIEKLREFENTESWLVQFKGEYKLEKRTIERIKEEEERPDPKFRKRLVNGKIKYYDPEEEFKSQERKLKGKKYLDKDGVLKYRYQETREMNKVFQERDPFNLYLDQKKPKK